MAEANTEQTEQNTEAETHTEKETESEKPEAKYTDEDVDKIVEKRLARERAKAEADKKAALDEAAKLAKMNADQKKQYEDEKSARELADVKAELATLKMGNTARAMFEEAGTEVSEDDLTHVVTSDADSTQANVNWLVEHDKALAERIRKEYTKGTTPRAKGAQIKAVTKEDFDKMTLAERSDLYRSNPAQFNKFTGGIE